ncbi:MAG: hypothetical protein ACAH59_09155 [Pseudobdellovibrionaceae bacterium]
MKHSFLKIALSFLSFFLAATSMADTSDAPLVRDVVALYDTVQGKFKVDLYRSMVGEFSSMKMDQSCPQIKVEKFKIVYCVKNSKEIEVGTLGSKNGVDGGMTGYSIRWKKDVKILSSSDAVDGAVYSLQVRN